MNYLIVFLGAGVGGALRHGANVLAFRLLGSALPFGTLFVNIFGSLVMGLIVGWLAFKGDAPQSWRLFLTTGVLGGFTTFSAFSLDVALIYERGEMGMAAAYAGISVAGSILALFLGLWLVRTII
jgi:CrcB protein